MEIGGGSFNLLWQEPPIKFSPFKDKFAFPNKKPLSAGGGWPMLQTPHPDLGRGIGFNFLLPHFLALKKNAYDLAWRWPLSFVHWLCLHAWCMAYDYRACLCLYRNR